MAKVLSTEDGDLSTSIVTSTNRKYQDVDLSFTANPTTKDIYKKTDAAAVKQAIKTLLLTNRFEKPFRPSFGADIRSMLFELADGDTALDIQAQIKRAIEQFEPRARLLVVRASVSPDINAISVHVEFQVINTQQVVSLETVISRLR